VRIVIQEEALPFRQDVRAAADMLGLDPMEVANEGKAVIGVEADKAAPSSRPSAGRSTARTLSSSAP